MLHRRQPWKNVKNVDVKKKLQNGERPSIRTLLSGDDPAVDDVLAVMKSCWKNESERPDKSLGAVDESRYFSNFTCLLARESCGASGAPIPRTCRTHGA